MPKIYVVRGDKEGTFKVLVNFIQQGSVYASKTVADTQAEAIRLTYVRPPVAAQA
tara:strand:- start:945 stop:1109 length:165 start_codon:yes stop_codon:yes gene_type:complete